MSPVHPAQPNPSTQPLPKAPAPFPPHTSVRVTARNAAQDEKQLPGESGVAVRRFPYLLLLLLPTPCRHTPLGLCLLLLSQQPLRDTRHARVRAGQPPATATHTQHSSPVTGRSEKAGLTGTVDSTWLPVVGQKVGSGHRCLVHTSVMILEPATHTRAKGNCSSSTQARI